MAENDRNFRSYMDAAITDEQRSEDEHSPQRQTMK
jgi:hypothetical protein